MNVKEAITQIKSMREYESFVDEPLSKSSVLKIVSQIDEPQKVVLKKFIADWIEKCKLKGVSLRDSMDYLNVEKDEGLRNWLLEFDVETREFHNQNTFAHAWLYGYTVEPEKLYTVEIPNPNEWGTHKVFLSKENYMGKVCIYKGSFNPHKNKNLWLTEEEIKKDFGWAWQFREEVE